MKGIKLRIDLTVSGDIHIVTMFDSIGFLSVSQFVSGRRGEQRLKEQQSYNPLPLDACRRCREIKTLPLVTVILIEFDLFVEPLALH